MTGCTLIELISKLGFIPKGVIDTPLDRLRGCIRKQYLSNNKLSLQSSDAELKKWTDLHNTLNKVFIYNLK